MLHLVLDVNSMEPLNCKCILKEMYRIKQERGGGGGGGVLGEYRLLILSEKACSLQNCVLK